MYADDTTIYFNLEEFDSQNTEKDINAEVEKVNTWLKLNKKSINVQKTKFMVFHRKQKKSVRSIVAIDNTVVKRVQSFNFLGIMLNEALSWKIHIPMVRNKISIVIGILYQLKYVFPENVLFTIYNSHIVSYINYGRLLWGVDCHKLETLQKKVLRFMINNDNKFLLRRMKRKKNQLYIK